MVMCDPIARVSLARSIDPLIGIKYIIQPAITIISSNHVVSFSRDASSVEREPLGDTGLPIREREARSGFPLRRLGEDESRAFQDDLLDKGGEGGREGGKKRKLRGVSSQIDEEQLIAVGFAKEVKVSLLEECSKE